MLHLKYRPNKFSEMVGHEEILKSIESLIGKDLPHAFLLSGVSGCGKTTIARLLATLLNPSETEIFEINIANTSGVDFIRKINEEAKYSPLLGDNKVYILDEVQMLTKEGQNCLLKLLEDSPKQAYFILCTTDQQKLLLPLRNRCVSYSLKSLSDKNIKELLIRIIKAEKINISDDILNLIIYKADGIPRSSLIYLNQVKDIKDFDEASKILADDLVEEEDIINLCRLLIKNPKAKWTEVCDLLTKISIEPEQIRIIIAGYLASCLKKNPCERYANMLELFLSSMTYGSQKSELVYLLYKSWGL